MSIKDKIEIIYESIPKYDIMFKIIIIGESGVGKSCLTLRVTKNKYINNYTPTIGFENSSLYFKIKEKIIKFEIWDTCGQETYRSLIKSYYQNSSLVILVYSIDDLKSYNNLNKWLQDIKSFSEEKIKIFLVGNKNDINDDKRKITKEMGYAFCQENNLCNFFESSAKTGYNINNIFIEAAKILYEDHFNKMDKKEKTENENNDDIIVIEENNKVYQTCNNNTCC